VGMQSTSGAERDSLYRAISLKTYWKWQGGQRLYRFTRHGQGRIGANSHPRKTILRIVPDARICV